MRGSIIFILVGFGLICFGCYWQLKLGKYKNAFEDMERELKKREAELTDRTITGGCEND